MGDGIIKKLLRFLIMLVLLLNISLTISAKNISVEDKAITTFEEYEEEFKKFDYVILIIAPSIIIGIGTIFYFKKTKKL